MKKTIILGLFLFFAFTAKAQLAWDVRLGANASQFSEGGAGFKLGVKAGVTAEYAFSKLFALRPGLYFSMKGSSDDKDFAVDFPTALNLSYLEVPVLASFRFRITERFGLAVHAGPYVAWRINKKPKLLSEVKSFDMGVNAALDFVFGRFSFGPDVQYGLTKVAKVEGSNLHNINYSLVFGYKF
ncbi:porin family protein [uncultured Alistipes sp.]|uniref:porin family protein n=1 Tax=uncultured Alistipes sp. TaxID=538949 RepID=UPI0025D48BC4|nr:porin family protein [uncultured Alistipes sp.]